MVIKNQNFYSNYYYQSSSYDHSFLCKFSFDDLDSHGKIYSILCYLLLYFFYLLIEFLVILNYPLTHYPFFIILLFSFITIYDYILFSLGISVVLLFYLVDGSLKSMLEYLANFPSFATKSVQVLLSIISGI